ncbi:MAG: hypothetical protein Q9220_002590 [cf. Caloplaca sp. 1 TL-2023]
MGHHSQSFVPGDTPGLQNAPYNHEVFRLRSGNEQSPRAVRPAGSPAVKAEEYEAEGIRRKLPSQSAQAAIKQQQQQRKKRRKTNECLNFTAFRQDELQSPRYLQYRERARTKIREGTAGEQVWDDIAEDAFQRAQPALRKVPPMGRKKLMVDGKLQGRNELISIKILRWTGKNRTRKQVSSHIQVLKPFMIKIPGCWFWPGSPTKTDHAAYYGTGMQHVTPITDDSALREAHQIHIPDIDFDMLHDDQMDAILQSCYANVGQTGNGSELLLAIPPAYGILGSNVPDRPPFINRIEFEVVVLGPAQKPFHSYTTTQTDIGASPRALEDVCNWRTTFPALEDYCKQGQLPGDIVLIESNLNLPSQYPPNRPTLSIRFNVSLARASGQEKWLTKADYYESGHLLDMKKSNSDEDDRKDSEWETPNIFRCPRSSETQLQIPLQSTWWVQLFTKMAARKHAMQRDSFLLQQEEEWSRRYLEDLSIMQELRMDDGTCQKRIAIVLWKFSLVRAGEAATTTWRKLRPPPQRFKVNSPSQSPTPLMQHSMNLDSMLQEIAMPQPVSVQAERFLHHSNMFAEDSPCDSPSSACSPAYTYTDSFPSSTSTSFPPSATPAFLTHEDSQESAYYSQEGDAHRHGSFASQSSYIFAQEETYAFKEPSTYDEGLAYPPEPPGVELPDQAFYSQHSFDAISQVQSSIRQDSYGGEADIDDFSAGQIQLAFEPDLSTHPYHTPYIASPSAVPSFLERGLGIQHSHLEEIEDATTAHDFGGGNGLDAPGTDARLHARTDYSALESHFTAEELTAIRLHDAEYGYPGEHSLHNYGESHELDRLPDAREEAARGDQPITLRADLESGSSIASEHARKTAGGLDAIGIEMVEVEGGEDEVEHGFDFEDVVYQEEGAGQGTDGPLQDHGDEHGFEEDDFREDHL